MKIRAILLVLAMLPALFAPGGSTLCLCSCPEMRAPAPTHSCCEPETPESDAQVPGRARLVAACSGCHPVSLPDVQVRQIESAPVDRVPAALPAAPFAAVVVVSIPRADRSLAWSGCRSPSPPGRRGALPLLI